MSKFKKISILFLIFIFIFSSASLAGPQDKIQNMNFKNADVVDVLRTIAEVADVNLITDSQVSGTITVNLKDISFAKALDLITQIKSLSYEWDENTVVVAPPERLDSIYSDIVTRYIEVNSADFDNIGTIVKDMFPETQISLDSGRRQFIIKGEKEKAAEVEEMINKLDTAQETSAKKRTESLKEKNVEVYKENYRVVNAGLEDLQSKLRTINSNLSIKINPLTSMMTISGPEADVKEALSMAKTYDQSLEPATRTIRVDYVDTQQINEIVTKFYPDIKLHVNKKRKEIIINGAKNKLDGVEELVKEINKPQYQVVIETRVEEVSTDFSRELGMNYSNDSTSAIGNIIIERNSDNDKIESLSYEWPEIFKLLNTSSDSKTLARPSLMTLNGEEAKLSITEEEPYAVQETDDQGNTTTTWEYAEAGVKLTFTPWITENNEIELKIAPEVSSFQEINADRYSNVDSTPPPATKTRSLETNLRLKDNETFAIGGLIQTDGGGSITKIPLLGDLPIFGELFKSRSNTNSTNELIIFVTPHIIKYGEEVDNKNLIQNEGIKLNKEQKNKTENNNDKITEKESGVNNSKNTKSEEKNETDENEEKKELKKLTREEIREIINK